MKFKKVYVTMIVKITKDGSLRPLSMVWEDGATYEIDRVLHITPAASLKVGRLRNPIYSNDRRQTERPL